MPKSEPKSKALDAAARIIRESIRQDKVKADALAVLECLALEFHSLVDGTDDEISGADFLDATDSLISLSLRTHLKRMLKELKNQSKG